MRSSLVIVAIGIALMAAPVNAGQTPAAPKPATPAPGAPAAQTPPPAAAQPAAAAQPPRPFPEGAKIAYVNVQHPDSLADSTIMISAVPEPETYAMMLAGLGLLGAVASGRKTSAK